MTRSRRFRVRFRWVKDSGTRAKLRRHSCPEPAQGARSRVHATCGGRTPRDADIFKGRTATPTWARNSAARPSTLRRPEGEPRSDQRAFGDLQIVGREDDCGASAHPLLQNVLTWRATAASRPVKRLVQKEELGIVDQGTGESNPSASCLVKPQRSCMCGRRSSHSRSS